MIRSSSQIDRTGWPFALTYTLRNVLFAPAPSLNGWMGRPTSAWASAYGSRFCGYELSGPWVGLKIFNPHVWTPPWRLIRQSGSFQRGDMVSRQVGKPHQVCVPLFPGVASGGFRLS